MSHNTSFLKTRLRSGNTDCIIRAGSPASPFYDAEILYISPSWIKENAAAFREENPRGTGENDFALLYVTRSLRKDTSLPEQFPYLTPETDAETIRKGDSVLLASYPAGFLGSIAIQKDLYQTSTIAQIKELFTFKENSVDMFSVGGNVVAQKGSSGSGAVSLTTGKILGIVVTSGESETTDVPQLTSNCVRAHVRKHEKGCRVHARRIPFRRPFRGSGIIPEKRLPRSSATIERTIKSPHQIS